MTQNANSATPLNTVAFPLYTGIAKNIIEAALLYWQDRDREAIGHLKNIIYVELNDIIFPAGEIAFYGISNITTGNCVSLIALIAKALKEMILKGDFYQRTKIDKSTATIEEDENDFNGYHYEKLDVSREIRQNRFSDKTYFAKIRLFKSFTREYDIIGFEKFNIKNAWIVYEFLENTAKKELFDKFGEKLVNKIIGNPRNPMQIEIIKTKNEEKFNLTKKLTEEKDKKLEDLYQKMTVMQLKVDKIKKKFEEKLKKETAKLEKKYQKMM